MLTYDFTGRTVFLTGGTSGIGLATARAFGRGGANVVVAARGAEAGVRTQGILEADGAKALFVELDVRNESAIEAALAAACARFGGIDVGVNCAGVGGDMATLEGTNQRVWDDVMAINARGVWLCMRHEALAMLASGRGGAIVNVSSIYGLAGKAAHHAYVASKHAVVGMTKSVGIELATRNVRVNALCAGVTATTSMREAERVVPEIVRALVAEHPLGRMATEDEIAQSILWLSSPASSYVTGAAIAADGGFLAA